MNCEICGSKGQHSHHIISKSLGGKNTKENLTKLCASCHFEVHKGNIIIEGKFLTSTGFKLIWHNKGEDSITGMEDDRVFIF